MRPSVRGSGASKLPATATVTLSQSAHAEDAEDAETGTWVLAGSRNRRRVRALRERMGTGLLPVKDIQSQRGDGGFVVDIDLPPAHTRVAAELLGAKSDDRGADERLQQECREPRGGHRAVFYVLQLRPCIRRSASHQPWKQAFPIMSGASKKLWGCYESRFSRARHEHFNDCVVVLSSDICWNLV